MKYRADRPSTHFGGKVLSGASNDSGLVNSASLVPSATGVGVKFQALGDDTNIDAIVVAKGSGVVKVTQNSVTATVATLTGTEALTGKTLTGNINADTKFCTTQVDATSSVTLANITGMTGQALVAGASYLFNILLPGTSSANGGVKYAFKYTTATLTSLEATARIYTASGVAVQHTTTATDQASLAALTAQATIFTQISGRVVVNAAGTVALQFAQNASHADTSSVYIGASMTFTRVA